ncbi:hypothetical protein F3Y22_tig00111088pilonHSYRG00304 [Hibiscus syriacus]|uniref:Uncharacterized protein n=1 Tax=Hibiscus syriacus TaxID=106335 RepID=A0A6A2Z247_HIBSY|nr:hypothetical protein F3Y22_tig00111088pilonHSYRG00304 [Hibiscus syriacus]
MARKFDIEKFNGRNFSLWKLKMKAILRKDGCLAAINERPVDFAYDIKWNEMDGNAMANFHLALADEVLSSIEEKKTAKEIWDHLIKLYEATSLHNKIFLKRKLYTLRMPESTSVTEHLNTLNTLFSQLTSLSCKIGEQERAELLLQSPPDSYDQLIINLTNSNVTSLVFDDVAAAVLQEENRRKNKEDRQVNMQQAEALTTMRGRSTERDQSSSHKHGRSKSRSKKNLKCYHCGKKGHLKNDCWSLNKNSNPQGNTANTSDDGDALCCEASTTVEGRKRFADIWLINSGATYHMTSRREWFHHYEPVSGRSVYSCNDHALEIVGVGTVKLKMYDGTIKVVRDVRHVKGLKKKLLSYGLLDNNASKIETRKGIMKVFRGALVVLKGEKIAANLYMLKGETLLEAEASVASCLTKVSLPLCEHCITSKQHRLKFNTSNSRGKSVLELVHSDVWQAPVTSLGGAKYFVSFIDDYSRRCWVHPIKKKSDVFSTFKNFKARVELDSGNKIKFFRTDNGGEYTSEEFDDFCRKEGIKRQFTVANTPQQNGVAERMNRTLLERIRAILRDAGLEKSFWAEAVNTACYLVNRAPSTAIELKTPMEMWTGKPVDYLNLHVFGSIVYVMYNSQEISKLDPKSRKCKFLGYADGVKGYRLWDPTARKVIISRDVIFVEDKLQRKEDDDSAEKSETTQIHVENEVEQRDSSEAEPAHDEQEPGSSEAPTTRQSDRVRRRPNWNSDYVIEGNIAYCLLTEDGEPSTYQEAIHSSDVSLWMIAMQEEIEALHKNNTWDLVPLPQGRKPIGNKWVFKIKRNGDNQVERYRARLVVKGYAQKEGIDFNEIFSPVVRLTTVRVVLVMCATLNLHLEQLDVKTAFLHGNLEEEIYMLQPEGFEEKEKKNLVCRLNKSLYGLKQAPRCWYKRFDSFIICLGYNRLNADPCAYFKRSCDNDFVILLLYVDDMLVAGPNKDHIEELKAQLAREFEMKDLGSANKILGMQIHRDINNRNIWLSQKNYLKKILSRFSMQDCKPISTPLPINFKLSSSMSPSSEEERMEMSRVPYASAVESLMFAMIYTRPDIAQAVGVVSRYMANPGKEHWNTVKRILRYIKGTSNVALCYGGSNLLINGYVDSDYAGDLDKSKSTTRYVFKVADGAVEEGTVDMQKIHTKDNIADFMTKAINADKFTCPIDVIKPKKRFNVWITIGVPLLAIFLLPLLAFLYHKKKTREAAAKDERKKWELPNDVLVSIDQSLKLYDFNNIETATENFSNKYKMGASVYRVHGEWLRNKSCQKFQIWHYRIQIALDVANGLHYLHNFTTPAYVHKDICSDNVLLDRDLRAKIANFSLARSAEREDSRKSSMWSSLGTKGYKAPEYVEYGLVTPEMDVYAFGVVLLELITGKEAVFMQDGKEVLLSEAILTIMKGENAEAELYRLIDPNLKGYLRMELARRMLKLSIDCLGEEPESRLSMAEVVSYLLRIQLDAQRPEKTHFHQNGIKRYGK